MKINWKLRFKNPVFWINLLTTTMAAILAHLGMVWEDITTWSALGDALWSAAQSPVVVVAVIGNIWNALNDPTTAGLSDSTRALTYDKPN